MVGGSGLRSPSIVGAVRVSFGMELGQVEQGFVEQTELERALQNAFPNLSSERSQQ